MSEWPLVPIRDLCQTIIDCVNKTAPTVDGPSPYRMIRTTNVKGGRVDLTTPKYVDHTTYERWVRRGKPREGDIILTREAPLGEVGMLRESAGVFLGQRLVMYRVDESRADRTFLLAAMRGNSVQSQIKSLGSGSTVEHMRVPDCGELLVACPPLRDQQRIGAVLAAFDELIAINERRIELLEDLARSLYREWFERRRLAASWAEKKLFDVADVGFGFSFKARGFGREGSRAVVRIRDVPHGTTATFTDEPAPDRYAVHDGDVLIGMDGDFHLNRWSGGEAWLNQRVARLRPQAGLSELHLMLAVAAPIEELNRTITGTTVAHLGKRHLEKVVLCVPAAEEHLDTATATFTALGGAILTLQKTIRAYARVRDLLLPRLVTGQLDVTDVDLGDLLLDEAS